MNFPISKKNKKKTKKNTLKKYLIFQKMEFCSLIFFLYFTKLKFLAPRLIYFWKWKFIAPGLKSFYIFSRKTFCYISGGTAKNTSIIVSIFSTNCINQYYWHIKTLNAFFCGEFFFSF